MTTQRHIPDDMFARAQTIAGLRQLADYLEDHPGLPVKEFGLEYNVYADTRNDTDADAAGRAWVDQIAVVLGATPTDDSARDGHYWVSTTFGRVSYRAVHIPSRAWARHRAEDSYRNNITHGLNHDAHAAQQAGQRDPHTDVAA
jgi:hypothetical protein